MPKVEMKLDLGAIDRIRQDMQNAAFETMMALKGEIVTEKVVPKDYGGLEGSMGAIDQFEDGNEIHTTLCIGDTPYARRLYFHPEYTFQDANNENAQGEWAEHWLPGGDLEGFVPDAFAARLKAKIVG